MALSNYNRYALPESPFSIPSGIKADSLSILVNNLLRGIEKVFHQMLIFFVALQTVFKESQGLHWKEVEFDFLVCGEFVRLPLAEHLKLKDINTEVTIDIEYLERFPAPEPEDSLNHDDWVSALHCCKEW